MITKLLFFTHIAYKYCKITESGKNLISLCPFPLVYSGCLFYNRCVGIVRPLYCPFCTHESFCRQQPNDHSCWVSHRIISTNVTNKIRGKLVETGNILIFEAVSRFISRLKQQKKDTLCPRLDKTCFSQCP